MYQAVSTLSLVPVRKEASDRSEMVTQLLFGELFRVEETRDNWCRITIAYDGYSGWVDRKQVTPMDDAAVERMSASPETLSLDLVQIAVSGREFIPVVLGSVFPFYHEKKFFIGSMEFLFDGNIRTPVQREPGRISEHAFRYIHAPYLWGGRSPFGIDCSGLTQMVLRLCGIKIARDAWQQAEQGTPVASLAESGEGDLAFFMNENSRVTHTGILLSGSRIIHASGKVRIDRIDEEGILNEEVKRHTHKLALIRRFA